MTKRMKTRIAYVMLVLLMGACAEPRIGDEQPVGEVGVLQQAVDTGITFGTSCQQEFENNWIATLTGIWTECSRFNDRMDDLAVKSFYYNLHNGKYFYENSGDQYRLDKVDIHYNSSHGGGWTSPTVAVFTMWDDPATSQTRGISTSMRLGDEGRGLSVMINDACDQLVLDGNVWTRWSSIMRGGLRFASGAHGSMYSGGDNVNTGKYFADYLANGHAFAYAWGWAATKADSNNTPVALASGNSSTDCANRRDNMKLNNFKSYPRRVDSAVSYLCWRYWN